MLNVVLRLRRDNDYNYAKIKDTFIPADGELCLVDTANDGLRVVCGDGITPFSKLGYSFETLVQGFYKENRFYKDNKFINEIEGHTNKIYIDKSANGGLYYYDGIHFCRVSGNGSSTSIPTATATLPGIMKLYDTVGNNIDGTMTQKAISDELDDKVEI